MKEGNIYIEPKMKNLELIKNDQNVEKDTFQCGKCRAMFQHLSEFMDHKTFQCKSSSKIETGVLETSVPQNNVHFSPTETFPSNLDNNFFKESFEEDKIISFIVSDNGLLISNPVDLSSFSGQVILTPQTQISYGDILMGNSLNGTTLAGQVVITPGNEGKTVYINPVNEEEPVGNMILTDAVCNSNEMICGGLMTDQKN